MPLITLTTDFGEGSPYVAAMKAVLLAGCPGATLVDVSHSLPHYDVLSGAFALWAGTRGFGPGSVHLAVVDPGVGSSRRAVAFAMRGSYYVGPDNGLFGLVDAELGGPTEPLAVELVRPPGASPTFEGRDVFSPAAAALAAGMPLEQVGRPSRASLLPLPLNGPAVLWVDSFGNLVTSLKPPLDALRIGSVLVDRWYRTFSEAPRGIPFLYEGSMGFVEVGVREGSAASLLRASAGMLVRIEARRRR
ncbi:MAG: SAM-dependent chlorinase/fluorinase [Candidatus Dormibacteraeota bacterium]|nr:SAM-dependent chlorinase/fluorinase [Candidatus Dormibacteraeota bacterium]